VILSCPFCKAKYDAEKVKISSYKRHMSYCRIDRKWDRTKRHFYDHDEICRVYLSNTSASIASIARQFGCDAGVVRHAIRHVKVRK
jgi:hypothetical protein